jgi:hypothetical protein
MQYNLQEVEIVIHGITLKEWQTGDVIIIRGRRRPRLEQLRRRRREFKARFEAYRERMRIRRRLIGDLVDYWIAADWFAARLAEGFSAITWPLTLEELGE